MIQISKILLKIVLKIQVKKTHKIINKITFLKTFFTNKNNKIIFKMETNKILQKFRVVVNKIIIKTSIQIIMKEEKW